MIHQKRVAFYKDFIEGEMTSRDPPLAPLFCTLGGNCKGDADAAIIQNSVDYDFIKLKPVIIEVHGI